MPKNDAFMKPQVWSKVTEPGMQKPTGIPPFADVSTKKPVRVIDTPTQYVAPSVKAAKEVRVSNAAKARLTTPKKTPRFTLILKPEVDVVIQPEK